MVRVLHAERRVNEVSRIDRVDRHRRGFARRLGAHRLVAFLAPRLQHRLGLLRAHPMRLLRRAQLRGVLLFDAVERPQDDLEPRRLAIAALADDARPQRRRFDPRRRCLNPSRLADQARSDAQHRHRDVIDPHAGAAGCPQQPTRQRRRKDIARKLRQFAAAVFQQAFIRRDPAVTVRERDDFSVAVVAHDLRPPTRKQRRAAKKLGRECPSGSPVLHARARSVLQNE